MSDQGVIEQPDLLSKLQFLASEVLHARQLEPALLQRLAEIALSYADQLRNEDDVRRASLSERVNAALAAFQGLFPAELQEATLAAVEHLETIAAVARDAAKNHAAASEAIAGAMAVADYKALSAWADKAQAAREAEASAISQAEAWVAEQSHAPSALSELPAAASDKDLPGLALPPEQVTPFGDENLSMENADSALAPEFAAEIDKNEECLTNLSAKPTLDKPTDSIAGINKVTSILPIWGADETPVLPVVAQPIPFENIGKSTEVVRPKHASASSMVTQAMTCALSDKRLGVAKALVETGLTEGSTSLLDIAITLSALALVADGSGQVDDRAGEAVRQTLKTLQAASDGEEIGVALGLVLPAATTLAWLEHDCLSLTR